MDIALLTDAAKPARPAARRAASIARATQGSLRHVARAPGPLRPWIDACTGADLIVSGDDDDGWCDALVGSTAERIARLAQRPVLLVRQAARGPYRRVLVPVDFSPWSEAAVALARRVVPQAALVLMHALDLPGEGKMRYAGVGQGVIARYRDTAERRAHERLRALAAAAGSPGPDTVVTADAAAPGWQIVRAAEDEDCDLAVIGKRGRHALDELLLGSTTRRVIAESRVDILLSALPDAPDRCPL